jgi:hypothetical protein
MFYYIFEFKYSQMNLLSTLLKLSGILLILSLFISVYIALSVAIASMLVVPGTYLYSLISGNSYNFICDQSEILYKLNKIGQYVIVISAILLFSLLIIKLYI